MQRMTVAVLSLVMLAGTVTGKPAVDPETQIRERLAMWVEAANHQDWKTALDVWAPDLIGWYPGAPDANYREEAEFAAHPSPSHTQFTLTINEILVSGSLAVCRDTWVMTTPKDHAAADVTTLKSFEVWKLQPDHKWRIIRWISAPLPVKS